MRTINGIVPVLSTPLLPDGSIDEQGLVRLLDYLLVKPIGGLWVLGTGSEDMNLTFAKRLQVARIASQHVRGRVPFMLGAGFFCMEDSLAFFEATKDLPVDAWHVMPYHPLLSTDRLVWYYRALADACPGELWLYTSGNWSPQLTLDAISQLKAHPKICGIKYSTTNAVNVLRVAQLCDASFQMITAVASQTYACMCSGSKAHTSSLGSAIPDVLIDIHRLFAEGRHAEALAAQHKADALIRSLAGMAKKDNFLTAAEEKYILSRRGICGETVSGYYRTLTAEEKTRIDGLLEQYGLL